MSVSLVLLAPFLAVQALQTPAAVTTKVRSAALFKNGLAFVQRTGMAPADATLARIDSLPVPTHGTFWVSTGSAGPALTSAVARKAERLERLAATNLLELLRANVGRKLSLSLGEKETLVGTLVSMPDPRPYDDENRSRYGYAPQPIHSLLLFDTGSGMSALDPHQVLRLAASEGTLNREFEQKSPGTSLTLNFAAATKAPAPFELDYLERGLTWVPSYSVDISEAGKALLTAKAEVINEAEELTGATLQFVTGYPNLQFAHVADPIALRGNLDAFLNALGSQPSSLQQSQVMTQAVMSNSFDGGAASASLPVAPDPSQGGVEDLFLYEQRDVTLARGERGLYPLFSKRVPCEHVYEWKIADTVVERYPREDERRPPPQEEIWHSLRLSNDSNVPWTTAPAMTQKGGNLLGQDTLRYTAVGAQTLLRITRALDVQGEQVENEIARERNSTKIGNTSYDKITVHGKLKLTSYKRENVQLEIEKRIQGEVTKNPGAAKVELLAEGLFRANPRAKLSWSVALEAGKTLVIEYEYSLYIPS